MADLKQRIRIETNLRDKNVVPGMRKIGKASERALGGKTGIAAHAGKAKLAIAAIGVAVAAAAVGLVKMTRAVAKQGDQYQKLALRLGSTAESLSQLRFVAERSGVTFETLTMGLQRMTRRVAEAAKGTGEARGALKELGISAILLSRLAPEQQFEAIAEAMHGVNQQSDKVRLSMKLFDSEGVALVQTMEDGAQGIQALREEADKLGVTMSTDAANKAAQYEDAMTDVSAALTGIAQTIVIKGGLLEGMTNLGKEMSEIALRPEFLEMVKDMAKAMSVLSSAANRTVSAYVWWKEVLGELTRERSFGDFSFNGPQQPGPDATSGAGVGPSRAAQIVQAKGGSGLGGGGRSGSAKSALAKVQSQSIKSGRSIATDTLLGYHQGVVSNEDQDIIIPWESAGTRTASRYQRAFSNELAVGLDNLFLGESTLTDSIKGFGENIVRISIQEVNTRIADKATEGLFSLLGAAWETDAGLHAQLYAGKFKDSLTTGSFATDVGNSFSKIFSADGEAHTSIKDGVGTAVKGGIVGAGIGSAFGEEVAGGIGGALGALLTEGSPLGILAGTFFGTVIGKIFGDRSAEEAAETSTAGATLSAVLSATGGIGGLVEEAGGATGVGQFLKSQGGVVSDLADAIRKGLLTQVIENLFVREGKTGREASDLARTIVSGTGVVRQIPSNLDPLQNLDADVDPQGTTVVTIDKEGRPHLVLPTPAAFSGGGSRTAAYKGLKAMIQDNRIVKSKITNFSGAEMRAALTLMDQEGVKLESNLRAGAIASALMDNSINAHEERFLNMAGFDVVAARGFQGRVNKPTSILAGEAGPEDVSIIPAGGSGFQGGGKFGRTIVLNINASFNSLDPRTMRDMVNSEFGPLIVEYLKSTSERGAEVMFNSGVVTPPSV